MRRLHRIGDFLRQLRDDRSGVTLVEFAFVGPVLILMVIGLFDIAHTQYTSSVLHGALQKAGRDLTLENANSQEANIDQRVADQVRSLMPASATVVFEKVSHFDFADIGEPEEFTDQNDDDICNNNEPYVDTNDNGQWDADRGKDGIGGARDAVLYTARVSYPRLFPLYGMIGLPQEVTLEASTVLRNQPFDEQNDRITTTRNCT
ncbi:TadE/TadG family type IV pilus assembly protein [Porphyrobacter sp. CACIAM 03H1]|jgi:Flp pilus assembly pilin Flp|uniref:TadE/TadG family type IV pilus assembly protein n=1 Tax=Porphyrobacter sp. CACIAM 03H1 TaxID=2003315 RepID=UPI000B5A9713|nr:TadE/TadG family type IV pilus assembly protein [Porphyrobacter sp. CACIAM 03H1]ASJ91366.1 dihydrolipoamide acetyltransferase [Porphyrobacter sp. CACIAM 03H1]